MQTEDIAATNVTKSIGSLPHERPMGPTLAQSDGVVGPNRIKWTDVFANQRQHGKSRSGTSQARPHDLDVLGNIIDPGVALVLARSPGEGREGKSPDENLCWD